MRRRCVLLAALTVFLILAAGPASAHGDLQGTSPEDGATIERVPRKISITLTEGPTRGPEASVVDGCKRKVRADVSVDGDDIVVAPRGGEPGRWRVKYRAVSSEDGHQTRGSISFRVAGKKDCGADPAESPGDDIDAADNPGILDNPNPPEEGSSWLLWLAGGTVAVLGLALFIRRSSR